jgi:hypothetical protein
MWHKKSTCIAVNAIMLAFLFLSVSFNKEYLRPAFAEVTILNILAGSFSNFIASYVISLFPVCPILTKNFSSPKVNQIVIATAIGVFIILTLEEFVGIFGASKVFDGYDILATALGSSCAIYTFIFVRRAISRRKNEAEVRLEK